MLSKSINDAASVVQPVQLLSFATIHLWFISRRHIIIHPVIIMFSAFN